MTMKAWVHRDARGEVQAIVATDDTELGELSLVVDQGGEVEMLDSADFDDPRDVEQLQALFARRLK
jgi:hypothetical protein